MPERLGRHDPFIPQRGDERDDHSRESGQASPGELDESAYGAWRWWAAALHVREWGNPDGSPIVFIHGWSQSHLCWHRQTESRLCDEFRLVAFDLRGHGMSEAPPQSQHYTHAGPWAYDLAAIIEELELERAVLVGSHPRWRPRSGQGNRAR